MLRGAALVLHAAAAALDPRVLFWRQRDNDPGLDLVTVVYAEAGGSRALPRSPASGQPCYWSVAQGPEPTGPALRDPCLTLSRGERAVRYVSGARRTPVPRGLVAEGQELTRRPFEYQPLCYAEEAERAARARATVSPEDAAAAATGFAEKRAAAAAPEEAFVVTVAMLQLVAVKTEGNPLEASAAKAESAIRDAKRRGADIALLPELWSVGYGANVRMSAYHDPDSTAFAYGTFLRWATPVDGPYVGRFQALARALDIAIALPILEAVRDQTGAPAPPRNTVVVIDRFGRVLFAFSKVRGTFTRNLPRSLEIVPQGKSGLQFFWGAGESIEPLKTWGGGGRLRKGLS